MIYLYCNIHVSTLKVVSGSYLHINEQLIISPYVSGHEGEAVMLPSFDIIW